MKRYKLVSKLCDRCGNDLMTGSWVMHLPYKKMYITLCSVCAVGLGIKPELMKEKKPKLSQSIEEMWREFWNEDYKTK